MWIRSQDKGKLINANYFELDSENCIYTVVAIGEKFKFVSLGRYETDKRTMEVLNEIQECIWGYLNDEAQIYIMPKE